jgi:hypothetical protein
VGNDASKPTVKDLYQILLDTRNLEIRLFWERSNYFLVLNSGIAFGFFNLTDTKYSLIFAMLGLLASALWFWVCLGGKFWQTRWEQRLMDFETEHLAHLEFFAAKPDRLRSDVKKGVSFHELGKVQRFIYDLVVRLKPSVSYSMIRLSAMFVLGWLAFILAFFLIGTNPFG